MVDLLHSMSVALGYRHAKADINSDAYYPSGYSDADLDQLRSRKLLLEVLEGKGRSRCWRRSIKAPSAPKRSRPKLNRDRHLNRNPNVHAARLIPRGRARESQGGVDVMSV